MMTPIHRWRCVLAVLLTAGLLTACGAGATATAPAAETGSARSGAIQVEKPWARPAVRLEGASTSDAMAGMAGMGTATADTMADMAMDGSTGAVYMTLVNNGSTPDALIGGSTDAAKTVELHQDTLDNNIARMRPVPAIDLPPGGRAEVKPGGYHLMLVGLTRDLKAGDTLRLTLKLQSGGELQVTVPVQEQAP